jgi:hypothetical protein
MLMMAITTSNSMSVKPRPEFADNFIRTHHALMGGTNWKTSSHRQ